MTLLETLRNPLAWQSSETPVMPIIGSASSGLICGATSIDTGQLRGLATVLGSYHGGCEPGDRTDIVDPDPRSPVFARLMLAERDHRITLAMRAAYQQIQFDLAAWRLPPTAFRYFVEARPAKLPDRAPMLSPLSAAREIKRVLATTWASVAEIAGVSEGTLHYWQREPTAAPRPKKVARLYAVHSLLMATLRKLGTVADLQAWLREPRPDGPSLMDTLVGGDVESFRGAVQQLVFQEAGPSSPSSARMLRDVDEPDYTVEASRPRRAPRHRAARARS